MPERRYPWLPALLVALLAGCSAEPRDDSTAAGSPPSATAGDCVLKPPAEPRICTMQWDPVCGCDGRTYSNACMAAAAGVPHHTPGACGPEAD